MNKFNIKTDFENNLDRQFVKKTKNIKCYCRIRTTEPHNKIFDILDKPDSKNLAIITSEENLKTQRFAFDKVFDVETPQNAIFHEIIAYIDDLILNKTNGLLFTFGKTNSGKTYTLVGEPNNPGLIPYILKYLYDKISSTYKNLKIHFNYIEIYNEEIYDLLSNENNDKSKQKVFLKETKGKGRYSIPNTTTYKINSLDDLNHALNLGILKKTHSSSILNENSSRSHVLLKIILFNEERNLEEANFSLVDLAGSEENLYKQSSKEYRETNKINSSLMMFCRCIKVLNNASNEAIKIVPYRESKLTMLLIPHFFEEHNILMIVNINLKKSDINDTLKVLNFAMVFRGETPMSTIIKEPSNIDVIDLSSPKTSVILTSKKEVNMDIDIIKLKIDDLNKKFDSINNENYWLKIAGEFLTNFYNKENSNCYRLPETHFLKEKRQHTSPMVKNNFCLYNTIDNPSCFQINKKEESMNKNNFIVNPEIKENTKNLVNLYQNSENSNQIIHSKEPVIINLTKENNLVSNISNKPKKKNKVNEKVEDNDVIKIKNKDKKKIAKEHINLEQSKEEVKRKNTNTSYLVEEKKKTSRTRNRIILSPIKKNNKNFVSVENKVKIINQEEITNKFQNIKKQETHKSNEKQKQSTVSNHNKNNNKKGSIKDEMIKINI